MQKIAIGILALFVLFFAAANARLAERQRLLESRLASTEPRPRPKAPPKAAPATEAELPAAARAVAPEPAKPAPPAAVSPIPSKPPTPAVAELAQQDFRNVAMTTWSTLLRGADGVTDLNLSDWQKNAIENLRKSRDLQTQVYKEQIQRVDEQTELAIRQLLDPRQLEKYDARGNLQLDVQLSQQAVEEVPLPAGQRPGYLGVSAGDAKGGGAQISEVMQDSAASATGLQAGDVILDFSGQKIASFTDLAAKIRATGEGTPVTLRIRRGEAEMIQSLQLGGRQK